MFWAIILLLLAAGASLAFMASTDWIPPWSIAYGAGVIGAALVGLLAMRLCVTAQTGMPLLLFVAITAFPSFAWGVAVRCAMLAGVSPPALPRAEWLPAAPHPAFAALGFFAVWVAVFEVFVRMHLSAPGIVSISLHPPSSAGSGEGARERA